jgi:hypothetical protein
MAEVAQPVVIAAASRIRPKLRFTPFGRRTAHAGSRKRRLASSPDADGVPESLPAPSGQGLPAADGRRLSQKPLNLDLSSERTVAAQDYQVTQDVPDLASQALDEQDHAFLIQIRISYLPGP